MNDSHNDTEKKMIVDTLDFYVQKLINETVELIHKTECEANQRFSANHIDFDDFSPANADYLTAALHDALFDRLHKGNVEIARLILTMNGKRVGACNDE